MNRKIKIAVSSVLTLSMVLSLTACNESAQTEEIITTNADFVPLQEFIETTVVDRYKAAIAGTINENMTVDKKIKYLGWWPIDETQASTELFKAVYGIPEAGDESYGNQANSIFKYQSVAYADRYTQLTKAVQAGDSPDIFQFELANYPFTVWKNLFEPVDDYIDFSTSLWDHTRDAMKMVEWNGKNYCPVTSVNLNYILWYRKSVVKEAGIDDPYELYKQGKWDWNTFLDLCSKFSDPDNEKYCIDGYNVAASFVCTTGVPIIDIVDGKLQSNVNDPNIERCVNTVISTLAKQNYRFPRHETEAWSLNYQGWVIGDELFWNDLGNAVKDSFQTSIKTYEWEDGDIFCVPYPKDPEADQYYHGMKLDPWMLCSGSQNTSGYAAWNLCSAAIASDTEISDRLSEISHEQLMTNYVGHSEELLDFLDELQGPNSPLVPVFDFKTGLGEDVVDTQSAKNPVDGLIEIPYNDGLDNDGNPATFTSWRDANFSEGSDVMKRINDINNGTGA
ncbi:MAG: extracellular solute-binding protein [Firmicutes bacterium]|nr:extracellular solute-binding protein [[Eubacterium] siraeum]MCM1487755.1 extracellular solute-binding protein [Bacillota bacterium]